MASTGTALTCTYPHTDTQTYTQIIKNKREGSDYIYTHIYVCMIYVFIGFLNYRDAVTVAQQ